MQYQLGETLRVLRSRDGKTQEELAKALGDRLRAWKAPMPTVRATGKPVPMPDEL